MQWQSGGKVQKFYVHLFYAKKVIAILLHIYIGNKYFIDQTKLQKKGIIQRITRKVSKREFKPWLQKDESNLHQVRTQK